MVACAYLGIGAILQAYLVAHLAMFKSIATHKVQSITVRQLRLPQCSELVRGRMQFELGGHGHFHERSIT